MAMHVTLNYRSDYILDRLARRSAQAIQLAAYLARPRAPAELLSWDQLRRTISYWAARSA
jgi:hypothetical protein